MKGAIICVHVLEQLASLANQSKELANGLGSCKYPHLPRVYMITLKAKIFKEKYELELKV